MNKERKLIIAGNWKMNKTVTEARLGGIGSRSRRSNEVDVVVCPSPL